VLLLEVRTPYQPNTSVSATIAIPVRNGESFIAGAIESALGQTFKEFNVVVVDNASTDGTACIVSNYPSVEYVRYSEVVSMPESFNRAVQHSTGTYTRLLCADDRLHPACLEQSVHALLDHPTAVMCASDEIQVDGDGCRQAERPLAFHGLLGGERAKVRLLRRGNWIGGPSAVTVRTTALQGALFDPRYQCSFDLECWTRLLGAGDFIGVKGALYESTIHAGQATNRCMSGGFRNDWNLLRTQTARLSNSRRVSRYWVMRLRSGLERGFRRRESDC